MSKCKHNRLPDRVREGRLPRNEKDYFCTQCEKWVDAEPINQTVDRRIKDDAERFKKLKEGK